MPFFAMHADEHYYCYLFHNFVTKKMFRKTQLIMTLSIPDKVKVKAKRYVELFLPRIIEECNLCYRPVSFSSRKVRLLTRQNWLNAGLPPTAVNLLAKMHGYEIRRTLIFLTTASGELYVNITRHFIPIQRTLMD